MKNSICAVAVVSFLTFSLMDSSVCAWDCESTRETLRGFFSMRVIISDFDSELLKAGLSKNQLQTDVETKLSSAGIKVLNKEDWIKTKGCPILNVSAYPTITSDGYAYCILVEFFQVATLKCGGLSKLVSTWNIHTVGTASDMKILRTSIKDKTDRFLNAWLSVNP